ncbi:uncharacterized protein TrAtP1_000390 [Trichoderma atroviride]|uniref:Uncharacterized protein n=1 Tax=Hypocrea atroviridis (strain ATCC 20476 / IMI 206040) TaxID=452589 RepID=G9NJF2_HYPAI|nr:uncharacterized protein TRIATDRAFT_92144 [Trichoderma atroviride IMI 206040]EHK49026.1 hypothetical protein TRIATDRAFT_92144 [Trichoderma atroviride IMI 206040]UKZ59072.1 hypothetical protein TrAtP1_000390 [Trichoderma atroviride]
MAFWHDWSDEKMEGSMSVDRLFIVSRSLTAFCVEIEGKVDPGFEIGWVTAVKVCLKYGHTLIGKIVVPDMPMMLDDERNMKINWGEGSEPEMEIKSTRAFKAFLQDVMPKKDVDTQMDSQYTASADLSVSRNGHTLTISMDPSYMMRMRAAVTNLRIHGQEISITMKITNLSSLELQFEYGTFILKKGQQTVGEVAGGLDLVPGEFEVNLGGQIQSGISGVVTLKGEHFEDCEESWQQYAIKLFEVEVNLDELDLDANHGATVDDDIGDIADHGEHLLSIRSK